MSLRPYQQLKPSGIEYLDAIPNDWPLKRLGDLVAFAQGKAHEPYIDDDGDYICVNSRFVSTSGKTIKTCSVNLTPASLNDILMVMSDLPNGRALARAYYVDDHGKYAVNQRVCRISAEKALPRFLFYLLDRHPGLMQNDDGVHQTHLSNADFQKLKLYLPSVSEQTQIARFLDHETARIDALIEEQQRLIELLKEKRQAVISHTVTKGLDPTVPMKDSGVEWLGEVPAHWICPAIKHTCSLIKDGTHLPPPRVDDGVPLLSVRNIISGDFVLRDDDSEISNEDYLALCRSFVPTAGDVLLAIVGATLGKTAIINEGLGEFHIQRSLAIFRADDYKVSFEWLNLIFQSAGFQSLLWEYAGFSAQPGIYLGTLSAFFIPLPSRDEQNNIVRQVKAELLPMSELLETAQETLALSQERRSALISAAVTGKIDVRGWQPPASAPTPELVQEAV